MTSTLIIMAAGIGSRFGADIKQLACVGQNSEIIMDYSIHDAIKAGFKRIIFIIRRDIEKDFMDVIGRRIEGVCAGLGVRVEYAFQSPHDLPEGFLLPEGRTKPWGTGQAILACRDMIDGPFAVINADDYYGIKSYSLINSFLTEHAGDTACLCMAGYTLRNTLSDHGSVTRGICSADENGYLTDIIETWNIIKTPDGASSNGIAIDSSRVVAMNMFGMTPDFMDMLRGGFSDFLCRIKPNDKKAEFLLPVFINSLLRQKRISVKILPTDDRWFGITYKEDLPGVRAEFKSLTDSGVYGTELFDDLKL